MKAPHLKTLRLTAAVIPILAMFALAGTAQSATTGSLVASDHSDDLAISDSRFPSVETPGSGFADPQNLWDGGSYTWPQDWAADANLSRVSGIYPEAASILSAPTPVCVEGVVTINASVDWRQNGPSDGIVHAGAFALFDASAPAQDWDYAANHVGEPLLGTRITNPASPSADDHWTRLVDTPVGASGTATAKATVDAQDLIDGNVGVALSLETADTEASGANPKSWVTDNFRVTYTWVCPPVAFDDTPSGIVGEDLTFDPLANDAAESDPTESPALLDPQAVQLEDPANPGSWGSSVTTADGDYTVDPVTGEVTFDPVPGFIGTATVPVPYRVSNTDGLSDEGLITVALEPADPSLTMTKTGELTQDANGNGIADVGDQVTYTFTVTNDGNVAVEDVAIDDPRVSGVTPASADLGPGENQVFTSAPYVVTQDDVDAGGVFNSATAEGAFDDDGDPDTDPRLVSSPPAGDRVETPERVPGLRVVKDADLDDTNGNGKADWGEQIVYSFTVTNTGNVSIVNLSIDDPMLADRGLGLSPDPSWIAGLAPGDEVEFIADPYTVTRDDTAFGQLSNTATATGWTTDQLEVTSDPDTVTVQTTRPAAALPDTGGASMWVPVAIIVMLTGGTALIARRQNA